MRMRYVMYIDISDVRPNRADEFVSKIKHGLKKTKFWPKKARVAYIAIRNSPTQIFRIP